MSDIKLVIGADVTGATAGLRAVQGELGRTAVAAGQSNSAIAGMGSKLSQLGSTIISGGVIAGVSLLGAGLIELGKTLFSITKEQQRFSDVLDGAKSAYVKSTLEVDKLKQAFEQARTGIISKEAALKLYNTTIGKTIGQTNEFAQAERMLAAQADNYIRFTLLKAAANIALGKAAESAFKAEEERLKGATKEGRFLASMAGAGRRGGRTDEERQQDRINKALKAENDFRKIALSLQEQAKAFGFDMNALTEKEVKVQKEKVTVLKEQKKAFEDLRIEYTFQRPMVKAPGGPVTVDAPIVVKPTPTFDNSAMMKGLQDWIKEMKLDEISEQFSAVLQAALEDAVIQAADTVGETLGNLIATGKFDVPNLFGGLMRNVGSQLQALGKFLITSSQIIKTAKKAFEKLLANPVAAFIVGIGLVALGAIIKAQASKQYSGFASGVRGFGGGAALVGERGPEMVYLPQGASVQPNNELAAFSGGGVNLMPSIAYDGTQFRIFLNRVDAQISRNG